MVKGKERKGNARQGKERKGKKSVNLLGFLRRGKVFCKEIKRANLIFGRNVVVEVIP